MYVCVCVCVFVIPAACCSNCKLDDMLAAKLDLLAGLCTLVNVTSYTFTVYLPYGS